MNANTIDRIGTEALRWMIGAVCAACVAAQLWLILGICLGIYR